MLTQRAPQVLGLAALADVVDRRSLLLNSGSPLTDPDQFRVGYDLGGVAIATPTLSTATLVAVAALWGVGALMMLAGVATANHGASIGKAGALAVMAGSGFVLAIDQQTFANHTWLIWLLCLALVVFSSPLGSQTSDLAWATRVLTTMVYLFAGIAKLRASWLDGLTLQGWLNGPLGVPFARSPSQRPVQLLAWATIAAELALAVAIWAPLPRWQRGALVAGFHLSIIAMLGLDAGLVSFGLAMLVHVACEQPPVPTDR